MGRKSEKTKKKKEKNFKSYVTTTMAIRILKRGQRESTLASKNIT